MAQCFVDHGIPVKASGIFSQGVGVDSQGRRHYYQARGQSPTPFYLLDTCVETGETRQLNVSEENACFPWGMCVSKKGKVYIGTATNGHFYEYDPDKGEMLYLGRPGDETYVWNCTQGTDGKIYGATYGRCKLVRFDPETRQSEDLGRMDQTEQYLRYVEASEDGYVYGGIGTARTGIVAYNIKSATFTQLIPREKRIPGTARLFRREDGQIYAETALGEFLLKDGQATPVDSKNLPAPMGWVFPDGSKMTKNDYEKATLTIKSATGDEKIVKYTYTDAGSCLFVLGKGPDNNVYGSSFLPLRLFVHDEGKSTTTDLGNPCTVGGEIYSFLNFKNKLVMAAYPGCSMAVYDPTKPWEPGFEPTNNPRRGKSRSKIAYRPHHMSLSPDGERVIICGIPDYGILGGGISVFNPETMEVEAEYQHVVQNQSIMDVCLTKEGLIAAGSGAHGGSGSHPTEKEGHLILWDYAKREKVFDIIPVPDQFSVESLMRGPDDLIYGLTQGGYLFVFDSASRTMKHVEKLPYGRPVFNSIAMDGDKRFIILFYNSIVELIPGTFKHRVLGEYPDGINCGIVVLDGQVFFGHKDHLMSFKLPPFAE